MTNATTTNATTIQMAAGLIWGHWQAGTQLDALPESVRPRSRVDGYAVQSVLAMHGRKEFTGWKIAATSAAGQAHIGVDGPLAGRLLGERTFPSDAKLSLAHNRMRVAEPEFAFRAGRDLPPRRQPYKVADVVAAMDAVIPALEVPDSRFQDFVAAGTAQLIADNACAHEFVLGRPSGANWRGLDFPSYTVHATLRKADGRKIERDGIGSNVLGDPLIALTWLVNELSGMGLTLTAGQVVTTGTCMQPLAIEPGDHVHADFGALGEIAASFV